MTEVRRQGVDAEVDAPILIVYDELCTLESSTHEYWCTVALNPIITTCLRSFVHALRGFAK